MIYIKYGKTAAFRRCFSAFYRLKSVRFYNIIKVMLTLEEFL